MCLQGGALVSSASTEQEVHQPSKNYTVYLVVQQRLLHPLRKVHQPSEICCLLQISL